MSTERATMIVVFDGICHLCSGTVRFLLPRDRKRVLHYATMQSPAGRAILARTGLDPDDAESFVFFDGRHCYTRSLAGIRIMHELGFPWNLCWVFWLVPAPIRDGIYLWLARNRYRLFGQRRTCYAPRPEYADRFVEELAREPADTCLP